MLSQKTFRLLGSISIVFTLAVIASAVFLFSRYRYLIVAAKVNGDPIYGWEYLSEVNQTAGSQIINQLVLRRLVNQEAAKNNISLSSEEIDEEMSKIEAQFQNSGGLDAFLGSQGLTRQDLRQQISLNLMITKLVEDQTSVSDDEIDQFYSENKDDFADLEEEEAKDQIRNRLESQKIQSAASNLMQSLQSQADIQIFLPGAASLIN